MVFEEDALLPGRWFVLDLLFVLKYPSDLALSADLDLLLPDSFILLLLLLLLCAFMIVLLLTLSVVDRVQLAMNTMYMRMVRWRGGAGISGYALTSLLADSVNLVQFNALSFVN